MRLGKAFGFGVLRQAFPLFAPLDLLHVLARVSSCGILLARLGDWRVIQAEFAAGSHCIHPSSRWASISSSEIGPGGSCLCASEQILAYSRCRHTITRNEARKATASAEYARQSDRCKCKVSAPTPSQWVRLVCLSAERPCVGISGIIFEGLNQTNENLEA